MGFSRFIWACPRRRGRRPCSRPTRWLSATTPSPTATITASPTPCQWALTADLNAFVRRGPGTNYDELGALQAGETVAIISRDVTSSWWVIPFGGRDGWVADSVVSVNECPSDVPVSTPPATSTPTTTPTPVSYTHLDVYKRQL